MREPCCPQRRPEKPSERAYYTHKDIFNMSFVSIERFEAAKYHFNIRGDWILRIVYHNIATNYHRERMCLQGASAPGRFKPTKASITLLALAYSLSMLTLRVRRGFEGHIRHELMLWCAS